MVVDHVEVDRQTDLVGRIYKSAQVVRTTVGVRGRKLRGGVVPPVALAGEGRQRQQFDGGDAQLFEVRQPLLRGAVAALLGKRPDVQFVKDQILLWDACPTVITPPVRVRVDDFGRAVDAFGLKPRGRVGHCRTVLMDAVAGAGSNARNEHLEGGVVGFLHRMGAAVFKNDFHPGSRRRDDAKTHTTILYRRP